MTKNRYKIYFSISLFLILLNFQLPVVSVVESKEAISASKETQTIPPAVSPKKLVAIDPGHGGKDSGCKSLKYLVEKVITLKLALMVKEILSKNQNINVFLTRSEDVDLSDEKRVFLANSKGADIFLSLHINASFDKNQKGIEIYYYSEDSLGFSSPQYQPQASGMEASNEEKKSLILPWDEEQNLFIQKSFEVASFLEESFKTSREIAFRSVNPAPLFVLTGTAMPAVVIETGFITNPEEEVALTRDGYLKIVAIRITEGITKYFENK